MDREWRESKVQGYTSSAPKIRKPSIGRPLRYAFIQPHGVNSLPKGVDKVHFDGCHAKDGSKSARATLRSSCSEARRAASTVRTGWGKLHDIRNLFAWR